MENISVTEFVDNEHKAFSIVNAIRNVPLITDGLKPSQRKILFAAMEYGKIELVDRLAMFAAARTNYKSGGDNLAAAISNMARNFPGTNNIPYFDRDGQFGSIVSPEPSSPRYISVSVSPVISAIFRKEDEGILDYNYLGEERLEPKYFLPIIPMYLVNGSAGIGTGYATNTGNHSVESVIASLRSLLQGNDPTPLKLHWNGYKGRTSYDAAGRMVCEGIFERVNATTIKITEVPVKYHSKLYESKVLLPLIQKGILLDFSNDTSERGWDITLNFKRGEISKLTDAELTEMLGLYYTKLPTLAGWDTDGRVRGFASFEEVIIKFFNFRLDRYEDRRQYLLSDMKERIEKMEMKAKFIQFMTAADLNQPLEVLKKAFIDNIQQDAPVDELFKISLSSITLDAKERLARDIKKLKAARDELLNKDAIQLYEDDLLDLERVLNI